MSCDVGLDPNGQPYAIFGLWERWEKGKEKEGREAISLVWLDERREKWVDLEWLNFGGGGGGCYFAIIPRLDGKRGKGRGILGLL